MATSPEVDRLLSLGDLCDQFHHGHLLVIDGLSNEYLRANSYSGLDTLFRFWTPRHPTILPPRVTRGNLPMLLLKAMLSTLCSSSLGWEL